MKFFTRFVHQILFNAVVTWLLLELIVDLFFLFVSPVSIPFNCLLYLTLEPFLFSDSRPRKRSDKIPSHWFLSWSPSFQQKYIKTFYSSIMCASTIPGIIFANTFCCTWSTTFAATVTPTYFHLCSSHSLLLVALSPDIASSPTAIAIFSPTIPFATLSFLSSIHICGSDVFFTSTLASFLNLWGVGFLMVILMLVTPIAFWSKRTPWNSCWSAKS